MSNYDLTTDCPSANPNTNGMFVLRGVVDFTKHNMAADDKFRMFKIPKGTIMLGAAYKVAKGSDSSAALDLGYLKGASYTLVSSTNSIANDLNLSAAGNWTKATGPVFSGDAFDDTKVLDASSSGLYVGGKVLKATDQSKVFVQMYCVKATDDFVGS